MEQASPRPHRGHVLVVDDDDLFRESVGTNLADAGFSIDAFADGASAIRRLKSGPAADLVLLDWKMPGMTGIEVLQRLRGESIEIPVIFLTVLNDQIYEEAGLLGGAVDFIEKSRSFSILLKRIELILTGHKSRMQRPAADGKGIVQIGELTLRFDCRRASWRQADAGLTLTEFNIVACLTELAGRDVSYREIYDIVHGEGFAAGDGEIGYRTNVRAFIKRIRQKFRNLDPNFRCLENFPGFGYRWRDGSEP
ncbi:MAG TPA: response regulator transcription factor [Rhizomicrobium sp.]